jgi:ABC-type transport system involved in multi-copper enzyme maturation permease subunit
MTFLAVLSKELRTRMRRERTIWLLVIYILILGLTGWFVVNDASDSPETVGIALYYFLSIFQLILIIFIVPAFTATAINGEKERQTYDLLICSGVTSFSIVMGKLIAGMTTALMLIGASIPLFSLLLFFGGVAPFQLLVLLLIYLVTALLIGSSSIYCSIILRRPAVSTALSYLLNLIWCASPLIVLFLWRVFAQQSPSYSQLYFIYMWSPFVAIASIDISNGLSVAIGGVYVLVWICYVLLSIGVSALFVFLSIAAVRPSATTKRCYLWVKRLRGWHIGARALDFYQRIL